MRFDGRSVVITGGARGIGYAVAAAFLDEGARVTLAARTPERLAAAAASLGHGDRVAVVAADVATVAGCERVAAAAIAAHGAIDVLVTSAGNYDALPIDEMTEELWDRTMAVHLKGTFFSVKAALPALREAGGTVVTIASDAGVLGLRGGWAAYCAAKGGIVNLTRQLALDLAPGVRVNCVAPGPVGTEHLFEELEAGRYGGMDGSVDPVADVAATLPMGRVVEPAEVAEAVLYVAAARSMTGAIIALDGGSTIGLP